MMIASQELYEKLKAIIKDDALWVDVDTELTDPLVLAFETGKAAGRAELALEVWQDWYGEEYYG
jgi:hypothetical protein